MTSKSGILIILDMTFSCFQAGGSNYWKKFDCRERQ